MDAHRAMRFIRAHAAEHKIAPDRIGVIGFSAGGELQGDAFYNQILAADPAAADPLDRTPAHANFSALIYGGRNVQAAALAPPTFIFCTVEDGGPRAALVSTMNSLRGAGVPVEAHFYQVGPHGTTLSPGDPQLGQWPELMIKWLATSGIIPRTALVPRR
jgi:acetyl esterase/lipase